MSLVIPMGFEPVFSMDQSLYHPNTPIELLRVNFENSDIVYLRLSLLGHSASLNFGASTRP